MSSPDESVPETRFGRALWRVSEVLALAGGALMLFVMVMTVVSIVGRQFFNLPIKGDYEITELVAGVAVFLFFPYTQITGQNLVAEFFTSWVPGPARARLEAVHALIFGVVAAFLAWRIFFGLVDKFTDNEKTILIGLPLWWGYVAATGACAVLTVVCVWGARHLIAGKRA